MMEMLEAMLINDNLFVPLNVLQYVQDYKMFGEDSFVFQNKDLLHSLYETLDLSMNDLELNGEALEYLITNNKHIGKALSNVYGIEEKETLAKLDNITAILASPTAMNAIVASQTAMNAIVASQTAMNAIVASQTAMNAIVASQTAMNAIVASQTVMNAIVASQTAMNAIVASQTAMNAILNSPNCMFLQNTGLPNCRDGKCNGRFLLVGSSRVSSCVDNCTPNYITQLNTEYKAIIQSSKFGTVYTKIGIPGVPTNIVFTMLDDHGSGDCCIVYKL